MPGQPTIDGDAMLSLDPGVVSTTIPGETVVLDPRADQYFSLEGVANRVWALLHTPTTATAIVDTLVQEYDVDRATCERDVWAFLGELGERELLVVIEPPR